MRHARRKFIEAQKTDPARAAAALAYYRQLYAIEKEIKAEIAKLPRTPTNRRGPRSGCGSARSGRSRFWEGFETWLDAQKPDVLPKSPLGGAIGYMQNQLGGVEAVHQLGLPVDRQQRVRATHEDNRNWTKELVVHRE